MDEDRESLEAREDAVARLVRAAGPRAVAPAEVHARVREAARTAWREGVEARRRRSLLRLAAAAAVLVTLAAAVLVVRSRRPRPPAPVSMAALVSRVGGVRISGAVSSPEAALGTRVFAGELVETASDGRAALALDDGASLRLDRDTRLRLDSPAIVRLERGAVYVDSGPRGRSLQIRTPRGLATDTGTQFELRLADSAVRIRVREGNVEWAQGSVRERAAVGEEMEVDAEGRVRRSAVARHGEPWAWAEQVTPPFQLEGRSLHEFLDWVSRETGFHVRLDGAEAAEKSEKTILHGSSGGMTPEEALAAVLPTCGLAHTIENSEIVIRAAAEKKASPKRTRK